MTKLFGTLLVASLVGLSSSPALASSQFSALEALCERGDGDAYLAIWSNDSGFEIQYAGNLDLGPSTVEKSAEEIRITSEWYYDSVVIPKGKSEVEILGSLFNCDY